MDENRFSVNIYVSPPFLLLAAARMCLSECESGESSQFSLLAMKRDSIYYHYIIHVRVHTPRRMHTFLFYVVAW